MSKRSSENLALLTVPQVARRLKVSNSRVNYAIARHDVVPRGRAGNFRLFAEDQVGDIEKALAKTDAAARCKSKRRTIPGAAEAPTLPRVKTRSRNSSKRTTAKQSKAPPSRRGKRARTQSAEDA